MLSKDTDIKYIKNQKLKNRIENTRGLKINFHYQYKPKSFNFMEPLFSYGSCFLKIIKF